MHATRLILYTCHQVDPVHAHAGSGQRVDPFSRTATGPTHSPELSWRAAVSATPAAHQSLAPQNDLYGDPRTHGACVAPPQPPFPHLRPPRTAAGAAATRAGAGRPLRGTSAKVGRRGLSCGCRGEGPVGRGDGQGRAHCVLCLLTIANSIGLILNHSTVGDSRC